MFSSYFSFLVTPTKCSIILLCVARMICTIIQLKSNSLIVEPKASISMTPSEPINDGIIFSYFLILYTMVAIADRSTLIPPSCVECRHICLFSVFSSHCISWLFFVPFPYLFPLFMLSCSRVCNCLHARIDIISVRRQMNATRLFYGNLIRLAAYPNFLTLNSA